jgi:hypothetical protein
MATLCKAPTIDPVYTASMVSKSLAKVDIVTLPVDGAVQTHQTDAPPYAQWSGSPASFVAFRFDPVVVPLSAHGDAPGEVVVEGRARRFGHLIPLENDVALVGGVRRQPVPVDRDPIGDSGADREDRATLE